MPDERQWLRHPETGGAFHCPIAAVPAWMERGWVPGEPPAERNPAIDEGLAARAAAKAAAADAAKPVPSKPARRAAAEPSTKEK